MCGTYLIWNELFVPLWSKSWHKHAIINDKHSISPKIFHHCVACWYWMYVRWMITPKQNHHNYRNNGEHHLCNIESMTPVMISDVSIILFHAQQPTAQHLIINMKTLNKIQLQKHSQARLLFTHTQDKNNNMASRYLCFWQVTKSLLQLPSMSHHPPSEYHQNWSHTNGNMRLMEF